MRIQHNIMAMNAYRNYTNNVSAMQKNLEKLSSGYKINRAGDDAAGLAISEKMRAQISGLEAAQKNAKDGISLVQTAEGALTEVHDMLNRMVTLATQSANGTYADTTDREQLQKEVNQLLDEINRIADSSNFNGIKLLDGTMDAGVNTSSVTGEFKIAGTTSSGVVGLPDVGTGDVGSATILHKGGAAAGGTNAFGLEMHNLSITGDAGDTFKITIGTTELEGTLVGSAVDTPLTGEDVAAALTGTKTKITFKVGGEDYDNTAFAINGGTFKVEAGNTDYGVTFTQTDEATLTGDGVAMEVKIEKGTDAPGGEAPTVTATKATAAGPGFTDKGAADTDTPTIGGTAVTAVDWTDTTANGGAALDGETLTATIGTKTFTVTFGTGDGKLDCSKETLEDSLSAAIAELNDQISAWNDENKATALTGKTDYTEYSNLTATGAANNITGPSVDKQEKQYSATGTAAAPAKVEVDFTGKEGKDVIGSSVTVGDKTYEFVKTAGDAAQGNVEIVVAEDDADTALATAFTTAVQGAKPTGVAQNTQVAADAKVATKIVVTADDTDTKLDGTGNSNATAVAVTGDYNIKTTDQSVKASAAEERLASTYFSLTADMASSGSTIRIGDETYTFTDNAKDTGAGKVYVGDLDLTKDLATAAQRLTDAAAGNKTYTVSQKGGTIQVVEQVGYSDDNPKYDLTTKEGIEASLGFTATTSTKGTGKGLTLQIGDTADSYNKLTVNIRDMHAKSLGLEGLNIANQEDAAKAIDKIKDAINTVSDVRGTLGATQNRLDHTINNLSVMTENIQDAESTIRDVDVAEEMMAYTKNSILIQSAQAMLAQANQVPQGVLQLLG